MAAIGISPAPSFLLSHAAAAAGPLVVLHGDDLPAPTATLSTWDARKGPDFIKVGGIFGRVEDMAGIAAGRALTVGNAFGGALAPDGVVTPIDAAKLAPIWAVWKPGQDRTLALVCRFPVLPFGSVGNMALQAYNVQEGPQPAALWSLFVQGVIGTQGQIVTTDGTWNGNVKDSGLNLGAVSTSLLVLQVRGSDDYWRVRWNGVWSGWKVPAWSLNYSATCWSVTGMFYAGNTQLRTRYFAAWDLLAADADLDAVAAEFGVA